MKIAVVGKGGSGKSTLSTILSLALATTNSLLTIDADINQHMAQLFGIDHGKDLWSQKDTIRQLLVGQREDLFVSDIVKTTPPHHKSHRPRLVPGERLLDFATKINDHHRLMEVGTYTHDTIGRSCYHNHLGLLENILSHVITDDESCIVVDMVAGTDAFSSSLYGQFDAIFFVVEPTEESVSVFHTYVSLAQKAGIADLVYPLANKIDDETDTQYLLDQGIRPFFSFPFFDQLKKMRRNGLSLASLLDPSSQKDYAQKIMQIPLLEPTRRQKLLLDAHQTYCNQDYVKKKIGDGMSQVDPLLYPFLLG